MSHALAVVIVSFNTRDLLRGCLASVRDELARLGREAAIWLVDNASADGSADMVAAEFPAVCLIRSADNLGFARGTNLGLSHLSALAAPPRYVLLLNPDTVVQPGAFDHLLSYLEAHPKVGAVGAQLAYGDGTFQHGAFRYPTLAMAALDFWPVHHRLRESWLNGRYPRRRYARGEPFAIDHPLGAAMMVRHEALTQVGPLDEGYFMYCEEIDWCLRARRAGWRIYCVPQARITHLEGQSTRQFRAEMLVALWRSRYRLFDKHYGRAYRWAVRRIVRAGLRHRLRRLQRASGAHAADAAACAEQIAAYRRIMEM